MATASIGQFTKDEPWLAKEKITTAAYVHRILGYIVLFIANGTVMTGLSRYETHYLKQDPFFGPLSMVSFCLLVLVVEIAHRINYGNKLKQISTPKVD